MATIINDSEVNVGVEGYNPFGWRLTGIYSRMSFDYDTVENEFKDIDVYNWKYKAWWCVTCYAELEYVNTRIDPDYRLLNLASWKMGSWNADYYGDNLIEVERELWIDDDYIEVDYWVYISEEDAFVNTIEGIASDILPVLIELLVKFKFK